MVNIFIPSYKRPGIITTAEIIGEKNCKIVVPESQKKDYLNFYDNVISIPDKDDGNIARKRNAILKLSQGITWMADDDIKKIIHIKNRTELNGDELIEYLEGAEILMKDINIGMYGFNISADPVKSIEYLPFNFIKPVYTFIGINHDIEYDETMKACEDVDMYLKTIYKGMKIIRDNRYYCELSLQTAKSAGGVEMKREQRKEYYRKCIIKWGKDICRIQNNDLRVKTPINGF